MKFVTFVRRATLIGALSLVLLVGASATKAYAQGGEVYTVSGVIIEGNRRIDTNAIKVQLKGGSGRVTAAQINEDVKTLYNTGFFDQVTVLVVTLERLLVNPASLSVLHLRYHHGTGFELVLPEISDDGSLMQDE